MANSNTQFFDRVRYTLKSSKVDDLVILEPEGWETDEKEYARHEQYHGIFVRFSNSLKFLGEAMEYIELILDLYGINEQVELVREERHPLTDVWTLTYSGYLDLSTWEKEDNKVSVKFNSGGIEQLLKSRESEDVELDRLTTIDGKIIPEMPVTNVEVDGRNIFLKTGYNVKETDNKINLYNQTNGQTRGCTISVPLNLLSKSHENAHSIILDARYADDSWERNGDGQASNLFFAVSDRRRTFRLKFSLTFDVDVLEYDDINFFRFWVRLAKFQNNTDFNIKENDILFTTDNRSVINGRSFKLDYDKTITLEIGESLGLLFDQNMDGRNGYSAHLSIDCKNITCDLQIEEDSFTEKSTTKAYLLHEVMDRLVTIGTNAQNAFYSDFLGRTDIGYAQDGKGSLIGITHGFWIRGFDKYPLPSESPKVVNLFKPLSTSFKESLTSLTAVLNVGIGIEKVGFKEIVRLEELDYFYSRNVTIRLPNQVKNVKRKIATNYYYSSLEFGYEKGGVYEEAMGLDEYNAKSTFTTAINRLKSTYSQVSKWRADGYGFEFARRKPKTINDTEDTPYDGDTFLMDLKRSPVGTFLQRKWNDDFEQLPTGVFSPETATNLRFSPFNCLLRHSWWFGACLGAYLTDYVRYASSTANSALKTKLIGGNEYSESSNIINSELKKNRFIPVEIEFEHICDFDIMQQINGTSVIFGKKILNVYGLVEFINEKNELERGYLFNLKPNGNGQWKVLKSNR